MRLLTATGGNGLLEIVKNLMGKPAGNAHKAGWREPAKLPITDAQTGFIHHRNDVPLDYKRLRSDDEDYPSADERGCIGLLFETNQRLKPGSFIEVAITLQNKPEKIRGKVVMVRERDGYYEIGLWLARTEDASRVRILEQSCYIEDYIKEKKFREGPFALNRDGAAAEWISKYAADLPG